jgi:hypothetical protein
MSLKTVGFVVFDNDFFELVFDRDRAMSVPKTTCVMYRVLMGDGTSYWTAPYKLRSGSKRGWNLRLNEVVDARHHSSC